MLNIMSMFKTFTSGDTLTKTFIIVALLALLLLYFNKCNREGFENSNLNLYTSSNNDDIFDDKYINLYEKIILDVDKDTFFIDNILENTRQTDNSVILNIGCKTGNINKILKDKNIHSIGLDKSQSMIDYCRNNNLEPIDRTSLINDFNILDIDNLDSINIKYDKPITHILCLNMEIYYIKNIDDFLKQCYNILDNNGYLILHLVDHKKFNSTSVYSRINDLNPNSLSIKRVNDSVIRFNDIIYNTRYRIFPNDFGKDTVWFTETITDLKDNSVHENVHTYNISINDDISEIASNNNFRLVKIINISLKHYNNEHIYIFKK